LFIRGTKGRGGWVWPNLVACRSEFERPLPPPGKHDGPGQIGGRFWRHSRAHRASDTITPITRLSLCDTTASHFKKYRRHLPVFPFLVCGDHAGPNYVFFAIRLRDTRQRNQKEKRALFRIRVAVHAKKRFLCLWDETADRHLRGWGLLLGTESTLLRLVSDFTKNNSS